MLLGMLGLLGLIICLGLFIACAVRRRPKKPFGVGMLICLVLITVGVAMDPEPRESAPIQLEAHTQEAAEEPSPEPLPEETAPEVPGASASMDYVLNVNSMKFHLSTCSSVGRISEQNRADFTGTRDQLLAKNYTPCGHCNP